MFALSRSQDENGGETEGERDRGRETEQDIQKGERERNRQTDRHSDRDREKERKREHILLSHLLFCNSEQQLWANLEWHVSIQIPTPGHGFNVSVEYLHNPDRESTFITLFCIMLPK